MIVLLNAGEIEIGGESSLGSEEHFPKACASFERQSVQNSALRQQLQQEGQITSFSAIMMSRSPDSFEYRCTCGWVSIFNLPS